jgi:hypothetical protein
MIQQNGNQITANDSIEGGENPTTPSCFYRSRSVPKIKNLNLDFSKLVYSFFQKKICGYLKDIIKKKIF